MQDSSGPQVPRPTVAERTAREVGAAVEADSLQTLLDVIKLQRRVRDWLDRARTERFRDGRSPFEVRLADVGPDPDIDLLPAESRARLEAADDERWHEVHRAMVLGGYPPGASVGQCSRAEAVRAVPPGESANERTIVCATGAVEPVRPDGVLRFDLDEGRESITISLDDDVDAAALLADADRVHLTHHSASALEAARSLGGALADTPPLAVLFEPSSPPRTYGSRDHGVGTLVDEGVVHRLESAAPLPDAEGLTALEEALAEGPFTTAERLGVARLAAGNTDCCRLRYGTSVPRLVAAIAAVLRCDLVPVPQTGDVLVTREDPGAAVREPARAFPDRQHLRDDDRAALTSALDLPDHAVADPSRADRFAAGECCAELAAAGNLAVEEAFYLEVSPWVPEPDPTAVAAAVDHGRRIVAALRDFDASHDCSLGRPALVTCWERAAGRDAGPVPDGE